MRRLLWLGLGMVGCTSDPLPAPTVNAPPQMPPTAPPTLPDLQFSRPPPRDMDLTDGGPDGALDAGQDAGRSDMQPADMQAMPDPDAGPGACQADACILAVDLTACDPCPVARPTGWVEAQRCIVPFDQAIPLFEYVPFDCTRMCPPDSLQSCNAPVGVPQCGMDGVCRIVSD